VTEGIQPYGGHDMGWTNLFVLWLGGVGILLLVAFVVAETRVAAPMFELGLFRIREFAAGNAAGLIASIARGGLQFMLIIWLQGIWLPLHGYAYAETPLWAGIYLLPVDFPYWLFAVLITVNGIGVGVFASPNSSSIMGSVPARHRGAASGMRSTFQNSGTALSIGVFFSLMVAGLANTLPTTLRHGLEQHGVPSGLAQQIAQLPPVASLFSAMLGVNPVEHLLSAAGALGGLSPSDREALTGQQFFPQLISGPFHAGLVVVFTASAVLSVLGAVASLARGTRRNRTLDALPDRDEIADG
jgi:hypothetical protein